MSLVRELAPRVVAAAVVLGGGWWGYGKFYGSPRAELSRKIDASRGAIGAMQTTLKGQSAVREKARAAAAGMLSLKADSLIARFRDGLARVGEQAGLTGISVTADQPQAPQSPLLSAKGVPTALKRDLRKTTDFEVVRGTLKGAGTLEQVLGVLAGLQAQSWAHRIEGISLRPVGKDDAKIELRVEVATILAPALAARAGVTETEPTLAIADARAELVWRPVAMKNPFREPSAEPVAAAPTIAIAAPNPGSPMPEPQPFAPYEDWKLTGVVAGRSGTEAFFLNQRTGARLTVQKGGQVLDAVFVEGEGERVVVEIGGKRFEVTNGQTLAARKPLG